jgi:signal transduction histidine kinase
VLGRDRNPLVEAVSRAPLRVRTKLVIAFALIVALILAVAGLGLKVLGDSNERAASLGTLQQRTATYRSLQTEARDVRQLLALRLASDPSVAAYLGQSPSAAPSGRAWTLVDQAIAAALTQLHPNEASFGFRPPAGDEAQLARARRDASRVSAAVNHLITLDGAGASTAATHAPLADAIAAVNDLSAITDNLASTTRAQTDALIAQSSDSYGSSRRLFFVVGAVSLALAVLLGLVLSGSLVGPIRQITARQGEIARGDFSRHIAVPNRDELGALAANLNVMSDELERLYGELATASRHKSEFLANVSHELRTPLNAIVGFSELLLLGTYGPLAEAQARAVTDVHDAGRHLLSVINDILDLSKIEAGKMELDLSRVSLRETLESGLRMHADRAGRAGVEMGLSIQPDDITLVADDRKVRQVVFNLLSNAVTFTPPGGRVDVSANLAGDVAEVAVRDTGRGVAEADREIIFEEFRQGERRNGEPREGTGLGLPLSRRFVELHGGRLWVEPANGAGSTFRFTLPVAQEA